MSLIDTFAHGLVSVLGAFARIVLDVLDGAEDGLRILLKDVGLSSDLQTPFSSSWSSCSCSASRACCAVVSAAPPRYS